MAVTCGFRFEVRSEDEVVELEADLFRRELSRLIAVPALVRFVSRRRTKISINELVFVMDLTGMLCRFSASPGDPCA